MDRINPINNTADRDQGPISVRAQAGFKGMSETELELLHRTGMAALRRSILMQLRAGAARCVEVPESRYQARQRLAGLAQIGRDIERLAIAGVILLREGLS